MTRNVYTLKRYISDSSYGEFTENMVSKKIKELEHLFFCLQEEENTKFEQPKASYIELPENSYKDLQSLLIHFNLVHFEHEFLSFISVVQDNFILYNEKFKGSLYKDYLFGKKNIEQLMNVLEDYLFKKRNDIYSISFKYYTDEFCSKTPNTIRNFFVIDEIYQSLLQYYGLNKDNFHLKRNEIIKEKMNDFNFLNGGKYVIMNVTQVLLQFLQKNTNGISENLALQFCGVFLCVCQIPFNSDNDPNVENIEIALKNIDYTKLRNYNNGRIKFFL